MKFEHWLARRYLSSSEKSRSLSLISWVSIVGLTLGVAALVIVITVMNGFQDSIEKAVWQMTGHLVISEPGSIINSKQKIDSALKVIEPYIEKSIPVVYGEGMIVSKKGVRGVLVEGVELMPGERIIPNTNIEKWESDKSIIIGSILAEELGIKIGDEVKLVIPFVEEGGTPKIERFKVASLFQAGMHSFDAKYIYIPFKTAQSFFKLNDSISAYRIYLKDKSQLNRVYAILSEALPLPIHLRTWRDYNRNLILAIDQQKLVISLLLIAIIIVAAFNVASSLFMLVMEKQKSISILRAIGASKSSIAKVFVRVGFSLGLLGTIGGILVGLVIVTFLSLFPVIKLPAEVYNFRLLPFSIDFLEILKIALVAMIVSAISTFYPAFRASKLNPIEGIRYE